MAGATPSMNRQGTYPVMKVGALDRSRFGSMRIVGGRTLHESRENSVERLEPFYQVEVNISMKISVPYYVSI